MSLPNGLMVKISKAISVEDGTGRMSIIVRKPFDYLEKELNKTFKGQQDVQVFVDRREGERRITSEPVSADRRRSNRRSPKQELVEVVLSV